MTFQRKHFPGDYRDDLYVFGISGARRMGSDRELIQNPTFVFFCPPRPSITENVNLFSKARIDTLVNFCIYRVALPL